MSGPSSGEYFIRSVSNGNFLGVNDNHDPVIAIVTVTKPGNSFSIEELEDKSYEIVVNGRFHPRFVDADEDKQNVVASVHPPGTRWRISRRPNGFYTFGLADDKIWPSLECTVQRQGLDQPVVLIRVAIPFQDQEFELIRK